MQELSEFEHLKTGNNRDKELHLEQDFGFRYSQVWVQNLVPLVISSLALRKYLNVSEPHL